MRIAIVSVFQVSNTFNCTLCDLDRFEIVDTVVQGSESVQKVTNVHLFTSMIQAASDENVTKVPIFSAVAPSSGRVANAAIHTIVSEMQNFLDSVAGSIDIIVAVLSGTMVTEGWKSGDAEVLQTVKRSVDADVPVLAIWSNQANLTAELLNVAELNIGVDLTDGEHFERDACEAIDLARRLCQHEVRPVWELHNLPLLIPVTVQCSSNSPLKAICELASEFEGLGGVLDASIFPGFPYSDTESTGCSVLVTVDDSREHAANLANRLRSAIWSVREAFAGQLPNV
ncbi:MAG TPA: M81 family metallopeptidase, partial [Nitrolancea sp.]|nr:M81 family metallopeptidase [Nitrolancea sp.]